MFRTRDFVLIFVAVVFLLIAIGTTLFRQSQLSVPAESPLELAVTSEMERGAVVVEPETISREERLTDMRQKIAESSELTVTEPEEVILPATVASSSEPVVPETVLASSEPILCPGYEEFTEIWPKGGVKIEEIEGARLVYTEDVLEYIEPISATSGLPLPDVVRDILIQLPIVSVPQAQPTCLSTDVVGIAQDGSLIRNNETSLYSVFGDETLIGYALDGLPIYGVSGVTPDMCGGAMVAGQYRYYLSDDRDTVLNCFSAVPKTL